MEALLIVGLIFSGVGLIFLIVACIIYFNKKSSDRRYTGKAYGEVLRLLTDSFRNPSFSDFRTRSSYSPEVRFFTSMGVEVVSHPVIFTYPCKYQVGQTVTVLYDENNPQKIKIAGDNTAKILYIIFFSVSALLLLIGIPMLIISLI